MSKFKLTLRQHSMRHCHPKIHINTKFGIPTSNNIEDMLWTSFFLETRSGQGHSDSKIVCNTLQPKDEPTHQIWNTYLKQYTSYAPDKLILETRSEVTVTTPSPLQDVSPHHRDSYLKYRKYALDTIILDMGSDVKGKVTVTQYGTRHASTQRRTVHQIWNSYFK